MKKDNKKYPPYSFWRIKRILEEDYDYRLEKVGQGYKANRKAGYTERYNLIRNSDNKILLEWIKLDGLRKVLGEAGYPLHDKRSKSKKVSDSRGKDNTTISRNEDRKE